MRALSGVAVPYEVDPFAGCERGWDTLAARSGCPTAQRAWAEAFADTGRDASRVRLVTVGPYAEPSALAPLVERWDGRLESLGVREFHEPADFLYAGPQAARALAEALVREGRALSLPRLPADSAMVEALRAACRRRGLVRVTPAYGAPYIALDAGWKDPERRFSARRRSDLRRALRRAERLGVVSFEMLAPSLLELPGLLDEAWAVEAAGWKSAHGLALACRPRLGAFFRRYAASACRKGWLRLAFVRIDGRPVAMQLGVECGGSYWLLRMGYDEAFAPCSPGTLLLLHALRHAAARNLHSFEFHGDPAPWTRAWTRTVRACVALRAYPATARGMAVLSLDAARAGWRHASGRKI